MNETQYLSCAETAKLVRKALKREFPGVKFSVRSKTYAGGASISIHWTDGPTDKAVRAVTNSYASADFDGMIDMQTYCDAWLMPDGSAVLASSPGTGGSRGTLPAYDNPKPHPDALRVHFGSNYVQTSRSHSVEYERVGRDLCALQRVEYRNMEQPGLCGSGDGEWLWRHVGRLLQRTAFAPGEVYVGVQYTPDDPSVFAWCGIVTTTEG